MLLSEIRRHSPWLLFIAITLLGIAAITYFYRASEMGTPKPPFNEVLTDRQKQLLSAEGDMSKWLLGLASGALAAVAGLRLKDSANEDVLSLLPMISFAFLLLSLYGAFLSYAAAVNILRLGPLDYSYGDQLAFPVLIQFWTLVAGLAFLGIWLFRRKGVKVAAILLLIFLSASHLSAQEVNLGQCSRDWYKDRFAIAEADIGPATSVLRALERQPGAKQITMCIDADGVLDQLRLSSAEATQLDDAQNFNAYLNALSDELGHPDLAMSDVVRSIIQIMSPWDKPLGVLSVHSAKGTFNVLLNTTLVGMTNWSRRLEPGIYRIRVIRHFNAVYSDNALTIVAGETKDIDVDKLAP